MKKVLCVFISLALLLALFMFVACHDWNAATFDFDKKLKDCDTNVKTKTVADGANIRVVADVFQVAFKQCDVSEINIDYINLPTFSIKVTEEENTLSIDIKSLQDISNVNIKPLCLLVRVPMSWDNCTYDADISVGYCAFMEVTAPEVEANINTGEFTMSKCNIGDLEVTGNTCSVSADGKFDVVCLKTNIGSVNCSATIEQKAEFTVQTGSVNFTLNCPDISAETDTGSINGKVKGDKSLYTVSSSTSTGSNNLTSQSGDGNHFLNVKTDTGSIKVTFDK